MGMALNSAGGKVGKQDEIDVGQREPNANVTQRDHIPPTRIWARVWFGLRYFAHVIPNVIKLYESWDSRWVRKGFWIPTCWYW